MKNIFAKVRFMAVLIGTIAAFMIFYVQDHLEKNK